MRTLAAILLGFLALPAAAQDSAMLLPLQDRNGDIAVAQLVSEALQVELDGILRLAPSGDLRDEMRRLRLRDADTIDPADLRRLAERFGVDWLISTTVHSAGETPEPQIVISGWAQRVEENTLAWAGFESIAGPGTGRSLGRGQIDVLEPLTLLAVRRLVADFRSTLEVDRIPPTHVSPDEAGFLLGPLTVDQLGIVAVIPFESITNVRPSESGETITALAHATLHRNGARVLHPGRVNAILRRRGVFMRGELDPLARAALGIGGDADHILTGTVETYDPSGGPQPNPHVELSARLVEVESGRILWISGQERKGWDHPGLFGLTRTYDAGSLAENIMQSLVTGFLRPPQR